MQRPQTFLHAYSALGLELSLPIVEALVWSLAPIADSLDFRNRAGYLHRENDLPATVRSNQSYWFINGKRSRTGGRPSIVGIAYQAWTNELGQLHRDGDLPAEIYHSCQKWYQNGNLHRDDDRPAKIDSDWGQYWYRDGYLHRDNGPAFVGVCGCCQSWYDRGRLIRQVRGCTYH